jgi:ribosomal protein S18 acetylase RimI-like enzyme
MVSVRPAESSDDFEFMLAQSPRLASGIEPRSHSLAEIAAFQDRFTRELLEGATTDSLTLLVLVDEERAGFVHVVRAKDEITGEDCAYVALLAVVVEAEGQGLAAKLMREAEDWAIAKGFGRLSLEVFESNRRAKSFYDRLGFRADTIRMVKRIGNGRDGA